MASKDKETIFQVMTGMIAVFGIWTGNQYALILSLISLSVSIIFWYQDNVSEPLKELKDSISALREDLNTQKEIESIRMDIVKNAERIKVCMADRWQSLQKDRRGALDPATFIILLLVILMIILYIKQKGWA